MPSVSIFAISIAKIRKKPKVIYRERRFKTIDDARERISSFISFYNEKRPHASIGMKTPAKVHNEQGVQQRMW